MILLAILVIGSFYNFMSFQISKGNPSSFFVAASDATAADKQRADFVCSGTADQTQINTYITKLLANGGGAVYLSEGTFTLSATIAITGDGTSNGPTVSILGAGNRNTILVPSTGTHGVTIAGATQVKIWDIQFNLLGTSDAIHSTAPVASPYWSFWQSSFKNLFIKGDFSAHSGWAMNLEAPFRSTFENIEAQGLGNGIYLKSTNVNFNPGNCTFIRCFMDLNAAVNGVAYKLHTQDGKGLMNICTFIQCEAIDSKASSTTSIGWYLLGSTTDYHQTKDIVIINSNIEQFNTCVKLVHSSDNDITLSYADTKNSSATGAIFDLSSTVQGGSTKNECYARSGYVAPSTTTNFVNDGNTDANASNIFGKFEAYVDTGATLSATTTSATILKEVHSTGVGTIDAKLTGFPLPGNKIQAVKVSSTSPTSNQVLTATSSTAAGWSTPSTNAATVTTNANLTGPITSVGNTTSIASQTGTGTKFVVDTSPSLISPTVSSGDLTITSGAIQANSQVLFNSNVYTQFQANVANINLNFKTVAGTGGIVCTVNGSKDAFIVNSTGVLQGLAGGSSGSSKIGGIIFNSFTDTSSTSTNGTEDDLYSYTIAASTLAINGDSLYQREHAQFVSSATASRRIKKYFGGTLIFDSGALTLTLGGDFILDTQVIRESSSVVRVSVSVVTTSASSVPYATYTRITGLTLTNTQVLKTTGIAAGTGAASGDIINKLSKVTFEPAA